jgi:WD repeat-containing protein 6
LALVVAHNSLLIYSLTQKRFTQRCDCEEQSLLYAAQIYLTHPSEILLATGTVFNEIQLWNPVSNRSPIKARLKGHEGCIFSLRFDKSGNLLASCSDDRTIRIWDIEQKKYLAIGFAHVARVWDVRFLPNSEGKTYLVSNSEDTTALLWEFIPSVRKLVVKEKYHGHSGKHVWSQAISENAKMLATGGNDGAINIWDIGSWKDRIGQEGNEIYWSETALKIFVNGKEKMDSIRGYKCVDEDRLVTTTKSG